MFKFTSAKLVINLDKVKSNMAGRKASARITVPPDMDWWFYQEFGTATHFNEEKVEMPVGVAQIELPGTTAPSGYQITAKNGKLLRLPITIEFPEAWEGFSVHHPGVSPKAFIRRILPEIQKQSAEAMATALIESGYNITSVQEALMTEIMPAILADITNSMAEQLNAGTDRDSPGKLGHADPASVFHSAASIVDSSG
jgi:hypothetical protein